MRLVVTDSVFLIRNLVFSWHCCWVWIPASARMTVSLCIQNQTTICIMKCRDRQATIIRLVIPDSVFLIRNLVFSWHCCCVWIPAHPRAPSLALQFTLYARMTVSCFIQPTTSAALLGNLRLLIAA